MNLGIHGSPGTNRPWILKNNYVSGSLTLHANVWVLMKGSGLLIPMLFKVNLDFHRRRKWMTNQGTVLTTLGSHYLPQAGEDQGEGRCVQPAGSASQHWQHPRQNRAGRNTLISHLLSLSELLKVLLTGWTHPQSAFDKFFVHSFFTLFGKYSLFCFSFGGFSRNFNMHT